MTITLPLQPREEAELLAPAEAKGISPTALLEEAVHRIIADSQKTRPEVSNKAITPTRSIRGILAKYGPAPSAEEIDVNRAEMLANFPRADF